MTSCMAVWTTRSSPVALPRGRVPPCGGGMSTRLPGATWSRLSRHRFCSQLTPLLLFPLFHEGSHGHAIVSRGPGVRLHLLPGFPQAILAPDFVVEAVKPARFVLLGRTRERPLAWPKCDCAVCSPRAIGHPQLLHTPLTEGGSLPSLSVALARQTLRWTPRTPCLTARDFGTAFYQGVSSGPRDSDKVSRPGTWHMRRVPSLPPRHLAMVRGSIDPHLLAACPGRRDGQPVHDV